MDPREPSRAASSASVRRRLARQANVAGSGRDRSPGSARDRSDRCGRRRWRARRPGAVGGRARVAGRGGRRRQRRPRRVAGDVRVAPTDGPLAFVLDSTWAFPLTAAALVTHAVAAVQRGRGGYLADLSRRANRHVYARGFRLRRGFLITIGNTVHGAGERATWSPRRRRVVTDHEDVHVWQGRWFGPLYPLLYGGWLLAGGAAGARRVGHRTARASRSPRSSRRAPTTPTRSSGGPTAATGTGRPPSRSSGSAGAARSSSRSARRRRRRPRPVPTAPPAAPG